MAIRGGAVEERDAPIDGRPDQGDRLLLVRWRAVPAAHAHAADPDGRHFQASLIERIRVGWSSTGGYNTAEDGIWANADVHAKARACRARRDQLAEWLNDIELLPEFLVDDSDRTGEFNEMLHSMARVQPSCQYIVEEFERVSKGSA